MTYRFARNFTFIVLAICCLLPIEAAAQTKLVNIPAEKYQIAPGGVDMRTGRYVYNETDLQIGPSDGGITLTRLMSNYSGAHANPFGNFAHNWDIMLMESRRNFNTLGSTGLDYRMNVHIGGRSFTFDSPSNVSHYVYQGDGPSALLTYTGGNRTNMASIYSLQAPDGTLMTFRPIGSFDCADEIQSGAPRRCAYVSEMIQPDGTRYGFEYAYDTGLSGNRARLRQVVSSRGYALLFEGSGSLVTKACVLNLAHTALPASGLCPTSGAASATYAYASIGRPALASATITGGGTSSFTYTPSGNNFLMGFVKPGEVAPWLTNNVAWRMDEEEILQEVVFGQSFATGEGYDYTYSVTPQTNNKPIQTIAGGGYTDVAGNTTSLPYDYPILPGTGPTTQCESFPCNVDPPDNWMNYTYQQTSGPVAIIDPLGRTTTFDYCNRDAITGLPSHYNDRCYVGPLQSFTDPEGRRTELTWDGAGNITQVKRIAKPGSGLPDIITSATYDISPANIKAHTKPITTTDAKGQVTQYSYSQAHGGILNETGPAVGGVSPQKRYEYAQRYAWIKNSSGAYVQGATPIWVKTKERICKTTAAAGASCVGGASDETVTEYDYGPDSGPNNLLLRGIVVTATNELGSPRSLRTCYGYDADGRKISETQPAANLSVCP